MWKGVPVNNKTKFIREELAGLLESLAEHIHAGELTLGEGRAALRLQPPEVFSTSPEVEDSGTRTRKRELELEIEWPITDDGSPVDTPTTAPDKSREKRIYVYFPLPKQGR